MRGRKRTGFAIAFLLLLLYISAITVASAVNAVVVSDVKGLGVYVPQSHSFTHGDTLKVYVEMQDVNHVGFVSVDFFFLIEDPKGHVVATDTMNVERTNYRAWDDYVVYTKAIPDWWLNGKYKLGIYAYDRVDDTKTRETKQKIEGNRSSPEKLIEGEGFELGDVVTKSLTDSRKEKTSIIFFVHPEEIIEIEKPLEIIRPPKPEEVKRPIVTVTGVSIDKFKVKPGETISISVTVKNDGIGGTEKATLVINGEKEAEESVTLGYMESKTLIFHVTKDLPGTYKVTIPGSEIVRLFFVEEGTGNSTSSLSASKASEAGASHGSGLTIHVFGIGIAFIAILTIVITLLRFRR
ncbi:MAG: hypothetical protein WBD09_02840 [Halobacteriota archaeon]